MRRFERFGQCEYEVEVTPIAKYLGKYNYAAKVATMTRPAGVDVNQFSESYGVSESEALAKVDDVVKRWWSERSEA